MTRPKKHLPLIRRHLRRPRRKRTHRTTRRPILRFSPTAWAKLMSLRDLGPTEVGGFGITDADDLLFVREFALIPQRCTEVTVAFEDAAVAEFFEEQVDLGRRPEQFARIWVHTHPGECPLPSGVDVETFERVFGRCDWSVMFILAQGGESYAQLHWRRGGPAAFRMQVTVDYSRPFPAAEFSRWEAEYRACVTPSEQLHQRLWFDDEFQGGDWSLPAFAPRADDLFPPEAELVGTSADSNSTPLTEALTP
ncbi:MAG: hypothetical protein KDA75_13450 [Planctomycetaceae bacterium]|nr:hypothetical protein [Planctomycetaceae bacterium]